MKYIVCFVFKIIIKYSSSLFCVELNVNIINLMKILEKKSRNKNEILHSGYLLKKFVSMPLMISMLIFISFIILSLILHGIYVKVD